MSTISIEIDSKWAKRARSHLFRVVVALQGVAVTTAPLFLYGAANGRYGRYDYLVAGACLATIYIVGWFYVRLGSEVIGQLRNGMS
jgi:hypothetical protein